MGRRKVKRRVIKKKKPTVPKIFDCPFCSHHLTVEAHINNKTGIGSVQCRVCNARYQRLLTDLLSPIDIYAEWIDKCEEKNKLQYFKTNSETKKHSISFPEENPNKKPKFEGNLADILSGKSNKDISNNTLANNTTTTTINNTKSEEKTIQSESESEQYSSESSEEESDEESEEDVNEVKDGDLLAELNDLKAEQAEHTTVIKDSSENKIEEKEHIDDNVTERKENIKTEHIFNQANDIASVNTLAAPIPNNNHIIEDNASPNTFTTTTQLKIIEDEEE